MNNSLTEEQRLRMEANRQMALQKKNRRRLESRLATQESFQYNNGSPKNNPSARESFGDSSIDWNAAVQEMDRIIASNQLQSNYTPSHNKSNKRKLDGAIEMDSASHKNIQSNHINDMYALPGENGHNGVNSNTGRNIFGGDKDNKSTMNTTFTKDQKLRMEKNRLHALEKKKAITSSAATLSSRKIEEQHDRVQDSTTWESKKDFRDSYHKIEKIVDNKDASGSTVDISALVHETKESSVKQHEIKSMRSTSQIDMCNLFDGQKEPAELSGQRSCETNENSSQRTASYCSMTENQRALIEQKRLLALQRKEPSFRDSGHNIKDLHSTDVNLVNRQSNLVCLLSKEQCGLIEGKRIVALEKRPPPYLIPPNASCLAGQLGGQHLSEQQASVKSGSNCSSFSNLEQKQLLSTGNTIRSPSTGISSDPDTVETLAKATSRDCHQLTGEKFGHSDTSKGQLSSNKGKQNGSDLPQIPSDIQYAESRCLPVDDGKIDSLIESAQLDKPLLNGWSLYDHQKEGVLRALRMRRLILAFDMGLGKTIIGCVWSKAFLKAYKSMKVFVITPVSLMEDWRRTAKEATGLNVHDGKKKTKGNLKHESSSDDTNEHCSAVDMFIFSWSNVAGYKSIHFAHSFDYVVICDEAHNMQSMTSKRTEDALKLMLAKRCQGALLLSGTPMKNGRPSNLFPLLRAVKHPFGDNQRKYEFYFCNGHQRFMNGRDVWDASGSSNLKELHAHTSSHIFRMTKDECMSDSLYPKNREYLKVPVSSRQQLRYNQTLKDLAQAFSAMQGTKGERWNDDNENNILQPFNNLRQASSSAKIDASVALANEILKEEGSLVIFTSFVAVAKEVHQKLEAMEWNGQLLTGETVPGKRQEMVDDFQSGVTPVFVCTYGAGGVGLTLTAACTVILIDRPWTPGDVNQAEDRVRRIGQTRPVRSIWIRAFPIDEQIDALIDHKEVNSFTAVDGKEGSGRPRKAPKISISDLVKTTLSNQASSWN